jgi:hypothetical protein
MARMMFHLGWIGFISAVLTLAAITAGGEAKIRELKQDYKSFGYNLPDMLKDTREELALKQYPWKVAIGGSAGDMFASMFLLIITDIGTQMRIMNQKDQSGS